MTDKKTLSVMNVEDFQKHMDAELTALEAKPDKDRHASLKNSMAFYNAIEKKDENTRIPVELYKTDTAGDISALEARIDELEKAVTALSDKKDDKEEDKKEVDEDEKKTEKKEEDEDDEKKDEEDAEKDADEDEDKKDEADDSEKSDVSWDEDMGHDVLSPAETVAAKKKE